MASYHPVENYPELELENNALKEIFTVQFFIHQIKNNHCQEIIFNLALNHLICRNKINIRF